MSFPMYLGIVVVLWIVMALDVTVRGQRYRDPNISPLRVAWPGAIIITLTFLAAAPLGSAPIDAMWAVVSVVYGINWLFGTYMLCSLLRQSSERN